MENILCKFESDWSLTLIPHKELIDKKISVKSFGELIETAYLTIPAKVPGNFELDLFKAGIEPDPFFSENAYIYQRYENRHLFYSTKFISDRKGGKNTFLRFEGIDTVADIILNGEVIAHTDNMFIEHEINVENKLVIGENELLVHIYPTMIEARKYEIKPNHRAQEYNYASLFIRKSAAMFGWDILQRFVSGGIWKKVSLIEKTEDRLEQAYLYTSAIDKKNNKAKLHCFYEVKTECDLLCEFKIKVEGKCGDSVFSAEKRLWHTYGEADIEIENVKLWYPRNKGEQNLYDIKVSLLKDEKVLDCKEIKFGVRTVELVRTSTTNEKGEGEFCFKINGERVFCMGTNWVPLDSFPSRSLERTEKALTLAYECGCNIIRVWGGSVYESDEFYNFCDQKGIMVWQDFCMGCGTYPQDAILQEKLRKEAVAVVKRLRNHPSLILWAGDNENDICIKGWHNVKANPNDNVLTRKILPEVILDYDRVRPYLPSSPYVDDYAFRTNLPLSEEHLWGPRDYFKGNFYKNSVCHFASETGYHGCPSPKSLEKFISESQLWPIKNGSEVNPDWTCHAAEMDTKCKGPYYYRTDLMINQYGTLFDKEAESLEEFSKGSQISQAEAKKYFIECFRIGKWRRTGIIWWNLIDGWPQISDAVVDYYYTKKLAYHYIKRSQERLSLMFDEPENGKLKLFAANDYQADLIGKYKVTDVLSGEIISEGEFKVSCDSSEAIAEIPETKEFKFLLIEWETYNGVKGKNHFTTKTLNISLEKYLEALEKAGFNQFEGF